ncbi:unnamed protein product [Phytophthora lilii]|uniref:Unnamed protein product n=1 Tax=Phytophthora lilii TaxID=2077276 RepID=A0A9W6U1X6_9STRA|nr:unnamed protein product [Phytophthora lilii]
MTGFSYPQPIFISDTYNPAFYLSLDQTGFLTYAYAQTLYLERNDYRLSYLTGISDGTATPNLALVPASDGSITGLGALSCSSLIVGGSAVVAPPSYVVSIAPGIAAINKALVLNASGEIATINKLTATSIYGTLQTATQSNITSLGTLGSLTIGGQTETIINTTIDVGPSATMSQYLITLKNSSGSDAILQGIAMLSSSITNTDSYTPGASITFQRSTAGGSAAHELLFNIKSGSSSTGACAEALRIRYDLKMISKGGIEINPPSSQTLGSVSAVSATNPLFWSGGSSRCFGWRLIDDNIVSLLSYSYAGSYNDQITWNHNGGQPIYTIQGFDSMRAINDNGNSMIYINNSNRFGINNTSPEATLHVGGTLVANSEIYTKSNSSANASYRGNWSSANYWGVGSDATTGSIRFGVCDATGSWLSYVPIRAGSYTNASDRRLKEDIIDIEYGLEKVMRMQPRKYTMTQEQTQHIGFIAQELNDIIPECVSVGANDELNVNGYPINPWGIDLSSLTAVLCKAIQELKAEVDELRSIMSE